MKLSLANRIKRIPFLISKFRTHVKVRGFGSALRRTFKYINYKPQYAKWFSNPLYTNAELEAQKQDAFDKVTDKFDDYDEDDYYSSIQHRYKIS